MMRQPAPSEYTRCTVHPLSHDREQGVCGQIPNIIQECEANRYLSTKSTVKWDHLIRGLLILAAEAVVSGAATRCEKARYHSNMGFKNRLHLTWNIMTDTPSLNQQVDPRQ